MVNLRRKMRFGFSDKSNPLVRHIGNRKDRTGRANREARTAVDAFLRVDKKLIVSFVNAIDWANFDARAVFDANTGLSNHRE